MENAETIKQRNWFERFVLWCMNLLLMPFHKKLEGEAAEGFLQFVKFALVGVTNTVISYLINAATLYILDKFNLFPNTDIYIGNTVAFILSVLWAFMLSNKFVFKEDESKEKRVWWKTLISGHSSATTTTAHGTRTIKPHISRRSKRIPLKQIHPAAHKPCCGRTDKLCA